MNAGRIAWSIAALLSLSATVGGGDTDGDSVHAPARVEEAPKTYAYACPSALGTQEYVKGVCVASFRPADGPLDAPTIALGPRDGLIAVAGSGAPLARVLVSTNGGSDWRAAGLPSVLAPVAGPGETISSGRHVALKFDARGTLHLVAGLIRSSDPTGSVEPRMDLYYTSSLDLGTTWKPPVLLPTNGSGAFPKLTISADRLYVTWGYRGDYRLNLATSRDDGKTWVLAEGAPNDCINVSEVAVLGETPFVAYSGFKHTEVNAAGEAVETQEFTGLRLYRLSPSNELTLVASLDTFKGVWPRLFAAPDGSFVLAAKLYRIHPEPGKGWDKCCAAMLRSVDEGRTWSDPVDVRSALRTEDGWDTFELSDARLDAWGLLHLIASGSDQADPANGSPGTDARHIHVAIDPASGRVLGESSLTPPTDGPQGYYPGGASLAFNRRFGVALWTYGNGLDYTQILPVSPERGAERDILFDSKLEGSEIWAIRPDGSGLRHLTQSPNGTSNQNPRWSPDGRQIAFASTRDAPENRNYEIYVMNRDGSGLQRLTNGAQARNMEPAWSPDGKRIAFGSNRDGNGKVYVMNADGSHLRRLTTDQMTPSSKGEAGPAWSPDGKRIAFLSNRDSEDYEIYILELETSKLTRLTDNEAHDSHVAWSPDGQYLSFDSTRDGNSEIYVMRPDGSQVVRLTHHPRMDNAARWSRDGQRLAFNSTRDFDSDDLSNCEIYVMNRDGSGVRRLTNNSVKDTHPDW